MIKQRTPAPTRRRSAEGLTGYPLRTGSWWPLLVAPLCIRATTRLVILPEEEYLADRFGEDYRRYSTRVRRWI